MNFRKKTCITKLYFSYEENVLAIVGYEKHQGDCVTFVYVSNLRDRVILVYHASVKFQKKSDDGEYLKLVLGDAS